MIDTFAMRCKILKLAFAGKLTEHSSDDESVNTLLSKINGKNNIKQTEHCPYEIPANWAWLRLSDLYTINPKVEAAADTEAAFIPMEKIGAGFVNRFSYEKQSWKKASKNHTKFADGDVAFAKISPCFENRKSFIAENLPNGIGGGTTELIILRQPEILSRYTYYVLLDQRFINAGSESYRGIVGQQRVKSEFFKNYLVPVPPFKEQERIVGKIETLFSVLDRIDLLQSEYSDNLSALKTKIIEAGIRGKLTEQLPEDGTAGELYEKIQREMQALIKEGKVKKDKPLPPVSEDEIPFEVPGNWKWVRLADIGSTNIGLTYGPHDIVDEGTIVVRSSNIVNGKMDYADLVKVNCHVRENQYLYNNDIVICARNGSKALVGKCALFEGKSSTIAFGAFMAVFRTPLYRYAYYYFKSLLFRSNFASDDSKQINQVTQSILKASLIPLPPLAEQKRIVAKLDEVLAILDERQARR